MLLVSHFLNDDSGAVTVDWIVLTAFLAGFGVVVTGLITTAATESDDSLAGQMATMPVKEY